MKEHTQTMGIRKWAGDDLIELQKEPLDALQALVEPYAPCIIQGCIPTPDEDGKTYTVSPGFVALKGKIVRFDGKTKANLPLYLGLDCKTENRAYADGGNKPIKYQYVAKELNEDTADDSCLTITVNDSANPHLVDTMGITQKLDWEGGDASHTKVVFNDKESVEEIKSGNTLAKLFGGIKKWLDDIKTKLDGIAVGAEKNVQADWNIKDTTSDAFIKNKPTIPTVNNGTITIKQAGEPKGSFTVNQSGNTTIELTDDNTVYAHPTNAGNKHIPSGGENGQYLKYSASGTAIWAKPTASEIGAASSSHTHSVATTNANGLMASSDKQKLDKIDNVSITINSNKIRFTWNKSVSSNMDISGSYYVELEGTFKSGGGMVVMPGL